MSLLSKPVNPVGKPNPVGRPRTVCPEKEELEALGIEMVEWFKTHPDALHISEWYSIEKFIVDNVWDVMIQKPEFLTYYELSMKLVGKKYLDKTSNVREGASQRWQRVYFRDLRKQEDADADLEMQRSKEVDKTIPEHYQYLNERLREELAEARQASSERKIADKSIKADIKS